VLTLGRKKRLSKRQVYLTGEFTTDERIIEIIHNQMALEWLAVESTLFDIEPQIAGLEINHCPAEFQLTGDIATCHPDIIQYDRAGIIQRLFCSTIEFDVCIKSKCSLNVKIRGSGKLFRWQ